MRKGTDQKYWEQEPLPLRSKVARDIRQTQTQTASRKATSPDEIPADCSKQAERQYWTECTECVAIWETGE